MLPASIIKFSSLKTTLKVVIVTLQELLIMDDEGRMIIVSLKLVLYIEIIYKAI